MTSRLWCYEDAHNWGTGLFNAAQARGYDVHMFNDFRQPDDGYVFVHMHHHPQTREMHKRGMAEMSLNPNLILVPDYRSSVLYDDKAEQAKQLSKWMPRTRLYTSPGAARAYLEQAPTLPFMSKSKEGASSHNVRFIQTLDEAKKEIKYAFSDLGIKLRYNQFQRGYVMWQEFIPNNPGDIRIIAIGQQRLLLRRRNRKDRPMASGSGDLQPITKLDAELEQALLAANVFFSEEKFPWCGIDLVKDARGKWYVLETTVGWTLNGYYECAFFRGLKATGQMGNAVWNVFLDELEAGEFDR